MTRIRFAAPLALVLTLATATPASAAPGDLDPTFAGDGARLIPFGANDSQGFDSVVMPDDGMVVAGRVFTPGGIKPALARVDRDGQVVRSFGTNGRVVEDGGGIANLFEAVERQGSKLLVAALDTANTTPTADFLVFRFLSNGALDTTFGVNGVARTDFGGEDRAVDLEVLPDGRFVVVGGTVAGGTAAFGAARFTANGALDPTFGNNGRRRVTFPGSPSGGPAAVALRPGGGIVVVGTMQDINVDTGVWAIAALTPSGALDPSFSGDGRLQIPFGDNSDGAGAVAVRQGKILVAGWVFDEETLQDFAVVRLHPDGSLDQQYGDDGVAILPTGDDADFVGDMALDPNGRAYVVGATSDSVLLLARVTPGGAPDPSFGTGGIATLQEDGTGMGAGVGLDSAGRALVGGTGGPVPDPDFLVARFLT